jgi:single-strand DNA-binding protein
MYARIVGIGYVGREPEGRYTANGVAVTMFSVATDNAFTDKSGQKVKETTWWKVSVFGKLAENVNKYVHVGSLVAFEGRMNPDPATGSPRVWEGKDGTWRATYELIANDVRFLNKVEGAEQDSAFEDDDF